MVFPGAERKLCRNFQKTTIIHTERILRKNKIVAQKVKSLFKIMYNCAKEKNPLCKLKANLITSKILQKSQSQNHLPHILYRKS